MFTLERKARPSSRQSPVPKSPPPRSDKAPPASAAGPAPANDVGIDAATELSEERRHYFEARSPRLGAGGVPSPPPGEPSHRGSVVGPVQAKLTVGAADDAYER